MPVASSGHVSLNGVKYLLAEDLDNHYVHSLPGERAHEDKLQGEPGKTHTKPERLIWSTQDWSNGEGNRVWYEDEASTYDYGIGVNTRVPGQVAPRPKRYLSSHAITATGAITKQHYSRFFVANNNVFTFCDTKIFSGNAEPTDTPVWNNVSPSVQANHAITAACGDQDTIFITTWKDDGATKLNNRMVGYSTDGGANYRNLLVNETFATGTTEANKPAYCALALWHGRLYGWTGKELWEYDISSLTSATDNLSTGEYRRLYNSTGFDQGFRVFNNTSWGDMVDCGTSAAMFFASNGISTIYQMKATTTSDRVVRPLWNAPLGFTIKGLTYANGVIFASGTYSASGQASGVGHGALYALPLDTLRPVFLKWVRKTVDTNLQMQVMGNSAGNQVLLCAAHTGRMFVYDADYDSLSMLDDIGGNDGTSFSGVEDDAEGGNAITFTNNDYRIGDATTYGNYRLFSIYRPGTAGDSSIQILSYANDEPTSRMTEGTSANYYVTSPEHDFNYPSDLKTLLGFHVTFLPEATADTTSGLKSNGSGSATQRIKVEYALDKGNAPSWTTAATITYTTTPKNSIKGNVFVDMTSSTLQFNRLRWRVLLDNNGNTGEGTKPPILTSVGVEAEIATYEETWELLLRIKDEISGTRTGGVSRRGHQQRDQLITLRKNRSTFAFIDGYRYPEFQPGRTVATTQVYIDELEDVIMRNAEGVMRVRLRAVPA